jgi:hypothetical protein
VDGRTTARLAAALALGAAALAALAPASPAATREPLRDALSAARRFDRAQESSIHPDASALRSMVRRTAQRYASAADEFQISSDEYGPAEVESVAAVLRSLDHGPEMARLSVFVAAPEELREACGAEVLACYFPSVDEMVVSGVDRPVDGVPRDFAIAHEYGHHIANTRAGAELPAIEAGPIRWATYERVCQLSRRGRLFPGNQGAHYWQDPEEAFAQSYARLNRPGDRVSWQYTPLLEPSATALAKIHADVANPVSGPVESTWTGSVAGPRADTAPADGVRSGALAVGAGRALGARGWLATRLVRIPLDGPVSVSLRATPGARLVAELRDPAGGRTLARAATDPGGAAELSYSNCGHGALRLQVRAVSGPADFETTIVRP